MSVELSAELKSTLRNWLLKEDVPGKNYMNPFWEKKNVCGIISRIKEHIEKLVVERRCSRQKLYESFLGEEKCLLKAKMTFLREEAKGMEGKFAYLRKMDISEKGRNEKRGRKLLEGKANAKI
jgi:hypothetical protein